MYHQWTIELKEMAERIISMRQQLFNALKSRGTNYFFKCRMPVQGSYIFT